MDLRIFSLLVVVLFSGCAWAVNDSIQDLTVETPGTQNAACNVYIEKFKYVFHPPQTLSISKSKSDMTVDCMAQGNRRKKIFIKPKIDRTTTLNAFNGVLPGLAWDYTTGALYHYPSVVQVDFTHAPVVPESLPSYENKDLTSPDDHVMESYAPGLPRLNSDRNQIYAPPARRLPPGANAGDTGPVDAVMPEASPARGKGDLTPARASNRQAGSANGAPVKLYPGQ